MMVSAQPVASISFTQQQIASYFSIFLIIFVTENKKYSCKIFTVLHRSSDLDQKGTKTRQLLLNKKSYSYFHCLTHTALILQFVIFVSLSFQPVHIMRETFKTVKYWILSLQQKERVIIFSS